uniref:UDP glucuronosyltransferase 1 family, polypeptide A1 n=1 Tax=Neogobius melanostomus TaxID=47308 RepID=A0A8C6V083_9GOBI
TMNNCSLFHYVGLSEGSKLLVAPMDGSHWLSMKILVMELSARGHEVVVLVPENSLLIKGSQTFTTVIYKVPYTKEELDGKFNELRKGVFSPPKFSDLMTNVERLVNFTTMQVKGCEYMLNNKELMDQLRGEGFDAMLSDPFIPCGSVLAHMFSIPAVYFLNGLPCQLDFRANQCPSPPSYIPIFYSGNTDKMNFLQRAKNFILYNIESYVCTVMYASFDDLVSRYISEDMTYQKLLGEGAIWLLRNDFTFQWPRPIMPNMVFIGGINCVTTKPLPAVLWRYEGKVPENAPKNVKLLKWLPQNDLLAHPKARLFMTHGGTHGIYEGICHGRDNVHRMTARGVAEQLLIFDLILSNFYKEKMQTLSSLHHDRPVPPLDLAVFWTEFVMRHKGADHLRVAAHDLNWIQYFCLDVLAFLTLIVVTVIGITVKCCLFCTRKCCGRGTAVKKKQA